MVRRGRLILAAASALLFALGGHAQSTKGTITEVDSDDNAPEQPRLHYYDKHGNKLKDPVLYLAELDTASSVRPQSPYPLWNGLVVGANFGDAVTALIGQKHSSYDVSVAASLHNWFFPIIEAGIGWGRHTEENNAYEYKGKPAFYGKVGINYNFLYKSSPDYSAYLGLRFGFSHYSWDIWNISPTSDLGKATGKTELLGQSTSSTYGEALFGIKVKIAGPFSLGWSLRYKFKFHAGRGSESEPWFTPGYGTGPLGFTLSAYWTIGEKPRRDLIKLPEGEEIPLPAAPAEEP